MGSLNVNRSVADAFYRYKMPRICAKVEGKGNGIKTVIVNMAEVAKALGRPATYPTKYFGCELGAQTQFDFKNERFIVNGSHDSAKLQDLLDGFIRKFVLCPECDNPETELLVSTKKNTISQGCKACGYHGQLDFNHKLNTFILKNPPQACNTQGASLTEGNRGKRSKRSGPAANGHDDSKQEGETNNSAEKECNTSSSGSSNNNGGAKVAKAPSTNDGPAKKAAEDEDEDGWTVDVSEEAVRARMQDLTEGAKNMTLTEDSEKNEKERMDIFYSFLKERVRLNRVQGAKNVGEIVQEAERLEVKSRAALVAMEVLVREGSLAADVRAHRALLVRLTRYDGRAQRHALYAIDALCRHSPTALAKVPALLKLLYDEDIVEENSIVEWANKPSRKYAPREVAAEVRKKAAPFLEWLAAAESEESDDDADEDDEDELEIEYSDRISAPVRGPAAPPRATSPPDEGIDVDIDAI